MNNLHVFSFFSLIYHLTSISFRWEEAAIIVLQFPYLNLVIVEKDWLNDNSEWTVIVKQVTFAWLLKACFSVYLRHFFAIKFKQYTIKWKNMALQQF